MELQTNIWAEAKNIPILLVAKSLNIEVTRNKAMCFGNHDRKSPSLSFSPDKNLWHCFGCGLGGTTIELVGQVLGFNPIDSAKWLVKNYNLNNVYARDIQLPIKPIICSKSYTQEIESKYHPDSEVYKHLLELSPLQKSGQDYLKNVRGFSFETILKFQIAQITKPQYISQLMLKKWGLDRLLSCGIFKITQDGKHKFVWWDDVLLFPFFDSDKRIIYTQARRLQGTDPKYVNVSKIKKPLFNLQILNSLPHYSRIYICEVFLTQLLQVNVE